MVDAIKNDVLIKQYLLQHPEYSNYDTGRIISLMVNDETFCNSLTEEQKISLFSSGTNQNTEETTPASLLGAKFSYAKQPTEKTHPDFSFLKLADDGKVDLNTLTADYFYNLYSDESKYTIKSIGYGNDLVYNKHGEPVAELSQYQQKFRYVNIATEETLSFSKTAMQNIHLTYAKGDDETNIRINSESGKIMDSTVVKIGEDEEGYPTSTVLSINYYDDNNQKVLTQRNENEYTILDNGAETVTVAADTGKVLKYQGVDEIINSINSQDKDKFAEMFNKYVTPTNTHRKGQLMRYYYEQTGRELLQDIKDCEFLSDTEKENYYKKVIGDFYTKSKVPRVGDTKTTKIENKLHTGDEFEVTYYGTIMHIKNKNTNEEQRYDLNEVIEGEFDEGMMCKLLKSFNELPGEVINDFAREISTLQVMKQKHLAGVYTGHGTLGLDARYIDAMTITHELGHAIDDINTLPEDNGNIVRYYGNNPKGQVVKIHAGLESQTSTGKFNEIYEKKRDEYEASGRKSYYQRQAHSKYFTKDHAEGFAEFYTYYMLGKSDSQKVIDEYFEDIKPAASEIIENTRTYPQNIRNVEKFYNQTDLDYIDEIVRQTEL